MIEEMFICPGCSRNISTAPGVFDIHRTLCERNQRRESHLTSDGNGDLIKNSYLPPIKDIDPKY